MLVFFLFEVLKSLKIHPIQYALVGLALAVFYLLLMSLAEHISFVWAYCISAIACVALVSSYISYAIGGVRRGLGFGAGLAVLYAMLYGLLNAEDYALLMGSGLVFVILALVMITTRHMDWYQFSVNLDEGRIKSKLNDF